VQGDQTAPDSHTLTSLRALKISSAEKLALNQFSKQYMYMLRHAERYFKAERQTGLSRLMTLQTNKPRAIMHYIAASSVHGSKIDRSAPGLQLLSTRTAGKLSCSASNCNYLHCNVLLIATRDCWRRGTPCGLPVGVLLCVIRCNEY